MGTRATSKECKETAKVELDAENIKEAHNQRKKLTGEKRFKFEIGKIEATEKLLDQMEKTKKLMLARDKTPDGSFINFVWKSFARHCLCEWGDISQRDRKANDQAIKTEGELFSTYKHTKYPTICILTYADRSQTIIGLQNEFHQV